MKSKSLLIIGCGDLGVRLYRQSLSQQQTFHLKLSGLCRSPEKLPGGINGIVGNYATGEGFDCLTELKPDYVLLTLKPTERSTQGYQQGFVQAVQAVLSGLEQHQPSLTLMLSSTRVYAETEGGWVDECSPLVDERDASGRAIVEAEKLLQQSGLPHCIIRAGGLYASSKGRLLTKTAKGEICASQPQRFSNRIHRDDCAGFLHHLIIRHAAGDQLQTAYTAVDNAPVPQYEVERWLAERQGAKDIVEQPALNKGHKRCSNQRFRESGYELLYPSYREGYASLLNG